jgi:hypothetical protein
VSRRARDKHAEVGAAMRQAIQSANAARLSLGEHRTFEAVLALTAGFGRLWDEVYVGEVRDLTGPTDETRVHEVSVRKNLRSLAGRGIIEWEPKRGTDARGKGFRSRLGLPRVVAERDLTERDGGSVSSERQTERRLGDRVKQPLLGAEDLELQGLRTTSRTGAGAREDDADELDQLCAESVATTRGAYWEPDT